MKHAFLAGVLLFLAAGASAYNDHRGFNLDSLERAVARWTPQAVDRASEDELIALNRAYRDLMLGWQNLNGEKCQFYARKALDISVPRGWHAASFDAYRYVGQIYYGREQYDSAQFYYGKALESVQRMSGDERVIDDNLSSLYGTLGNLHNMMGDIPVAMDYYAKAGAIFDKYGWNESNTILWYNIGETWMDQEEFGKAEKAYVKAEAYARASADSLMLILSYKGLGRLWVEQKRPGKALKYLREVNAYYTLHPDDSPVFRRETLELIDTVLSRQKRQLCWGLAGSGLLILLLGTLLVVLLRLRRARKQQAEASQLIEETIQDLHPKQREITLSVREKDVLDLLSKGYTAPQIAEAMDLSYETIRWYRKKLISKLDVANTAELISLSKEMGLI